MNREAISTEQEKELSGNELAGIAARKKQSLEEQGEKIFAINSKAEAEEMLGRLTKGRRSFLEAAGAGKESDESVSSVLVLYDLYILHLEEKLKEFDPAKSPAEAKTSKKGERDNETKEIMEKYPKLLENLREENREYLLSIYIKSLKKHNSTEQGMDKLKEALSEREPVSLPYGSLFAREKTYFTKEAAGIEQDEHPSDKEFNAIKEILRNRLDEKYLSIDRKTFEEMTGESIEIAEQEKTEETISPEDGPIEDPTKRTGQEEEEIPEIQEENHKTLIEKLKASASYQEIKTEEPETTTTPPENPEETREIEIPQTVRELLALQQLFKDARINMEKLQAAKSEKLQVRLGSERESSSEEMEAYETEIADLEREMQRIQRAINLAAGNEIVIGAMGKFEQIARPDNKDEDIEKRMLLLALAARQGAEMALGESREEVGRVAEGGKRTMLERLSRTVSQESHRMQSGEYECKVTSIEVGMLRKGKAKILRDSSLLRTLLKITEKDDYLEEMLDAKDRKELQITKNVLTEENGEAGDKIEFVIEWSNEEGQEKEFIVNVDLQGEKSDGFLKGLFRNREEDKTIKVSFSETIEESVPRTDNRNARTVSDVRNPANEPDRQQNPEEVIIPAATEANSIIDSPEDISRKKYAEAFDFLEQMAGESWSADIKEEAKRAIEKLKRGETKEAAILIKSKIEAKEMAKGTATGKEKDFIELEIKRLKKILKHLEEEKVLVPLKEMKNQKKPEAVKTELNKAPKITVPEGVFDDSEFFTEKAAADNDIGKSPLSDERIKIIFDQLGGKIRKENIRATAEFIHSKDPLLENQALIQTWERLAKGELTEDQLKNSSFGEMIKGTVEDKQAAAKIIEKFRETTGLEHPDEELSLYDASVIWKNIHRNSNKH